MSSEISVIVPVFNEAGFIESMIDSLLSNKEISKELLLVDGGSTDQTKQVIKQFELLFPEVKYISNPDKFVSAGFNKAYLCSTGKYIAFLGAHALYPDNFFKLAINHLATQNCDAVGGPLNQIGRTTKGKAIAYAMSQPIGVGNTEFRTLKKKMYVDSVAFAVYKREVFEKIGLMDTDLLRNQDDEFHYRMNANGMKILMVPEMQCSYYVRDNFLTLFKQYFQYGLYKPMVLKKVNSGLKLRHLAPTFLILYISFSPLLIIFSMWFIFPILTYFGLVIYFAFKYKGSLIEKSYAMISFFTLHLSYGIGFLRGMLMLKSND